MNKNVTDRYLLTASGEQEAFRILYDRYWKLLYDKAFRRLGDEADAEDAVQEVFISLWRNKNTIEVEETLAPYLFTALKYCIIRKIYRKAGRGLLTPLSLIELDNPQASAEESFTYKELQVFINKGIDELPDRMREIFRLSRGENLSNREIAEHLSISEQTVKNTLSAALKKLRIKLSHFVSFCFLQF